MYFRLSSILSVLLVVAAAYGLYLVKWEVRELKRQNTLLEAEILAEQRAYKLLQTEWAYLNRPQRLRELAHKHLKMERSQGNQIIEHMALIPQPKGEEILQNARDSVQPVGYRPREAR